MKTGAISGSFDVLHHGHVDLIKRSAAICDTLHIIIANNPAKKHWFDACTRERHLWNALDTNNISNAKIHTLTNGFLVKKIAELDAVSIRGLRNVTDFAYEENMLRVNATLNANIETVFLFTDPTLMHISSSMVKEVAKISIEDAAKYVPRMVFDSLFDAVRSAV